MENHLAPFTTVMLPFVLFLLLHPLCERVVEAQGAVQLFSDSGCSSPDIPSISLAADSCLETYQGRGGWYLVVTIVWQWQCGSNYL
jgi:hypothetical protein